MKKVTRKGQHTIEGNEGELTLVKATAEYVAHKLGGEAGVTEGAYDDETDYAIYNTTATIKEFSEVYAEALELLRSKSNDIVKCVEICEEFNLQGEQLSQLSDAMYFDALTLRQALKAATETY